MPPLHGFGPGQEAEHPEYAGRYRLESCLGAGGMGVVHLATSASGLRLAIKVVHAKYASDPEFRARFRQEVNAARRVSGAFTAPVVDADPDAELPWMATLFIPGPTLYEQVKRNGALQPDEVRGLGAGLAEALRDIHRAGVVHRDLKPSNVLLASDGPKVIDFGISRPSDSELHTETGKLIGSPPFMAPEQFQRPREVGPAADVFAMGAVLAHAARGRGPFDSDSPYIVAYQVVHDEPDLEGVPDDLVPLVQRCLAKDPAERPTAAEVTEILRHPVPGLPFHVPGRRRVPEEEHTEGGTARSDGGPAPVPGPYGPPARTAGPAVRRPEEEPGGEPAGGAAQEEHGDGPAAGSPARTTAASVRGALRRRVPAVLGGALALAVMGGVGVWALSAEGPPSRTAAARTGTGPSGASKSWAASLGDGPPPWCAAGPDDALYCSVTGVTAVRLDPADGRIVWENRGKDGSSDGADGTVVSDAPLSSGGLLHVTVGGRLKALDPRTGKVRWDLDVSAYASVAHSADTTLLVGAGGSVRALDSATGERRWDAAVGGLGTQWIGGTGGTGGAGGSGTFYAVTPDDDGSASDVSAVSEETGEVLWTERAEGNLVPFAAPDGALYSLSLNLSQTADAVVRLDTRERRVRRVPLAIGLDGAQAAESGGIVYVSGTGGALVAVDTRADAAGADRELWRLQTSVATPSRPAVSGGTVHLLAPDGRLLAADARTGKPLGQTRPRLGGSTDTLVAALPAPVVRDGRVYGSAPDGSVFAVDAGAPDTW